MFKNNDDLVIQGLIPWNLKPFYLLTKVERHKVEEHLIM